jgi:hypothetical protein
VAGFFGPNRDQYGFSALEGLLGRLGPFTANRGSGPNWPKKITQNFPLKKITPVIKIFLTRRFNSLLHLTFGKFLFFSNSTKPLTASA